MYKVYWTEQETNFPKSKDFDDLMLALAECENLRKNNYKFVTMVSENPNMVGKYGVSEIKNGKLPDGSNYVVDNDKNTLIKSKKNYISTDNIEVELDDTY